MLLLTEVKQKIMLLISTAALSTWPFPGALLCVSLMEPVETSVHLLSLWVLLFTLQCQY